MATPNCHSLHIDRHNDRSSLLQGRPHRMGRCRVLRLGWGSSPDPHEDHESFNRSRNRADTETCVKREVRLAP